MMDKDQYQPIACSAYDIYEIAIMRGQKLDLTWFDAQGMRLSDRVTPINLRIMDGAEYLIFEVCTGNQDKQQVRLDKIASASIV